MANNNIEQRIRQQLADHPVILYMKGVPDAPECGFSANAVAALKQTNVPFTYVNVMGAPFIREKLPKISKWPTYPQLFVNGELLGGADIIESMLADGSLLKTLEAAVADASDDAVISHSEVEALIKADYPDASLVIKGEGCDLTISVVSSQFEGQSLLQQQQGVMNSLSKPIEESRLHAVRIKAYTPADWEAAQDKKPDAGLMQIQSD